MEEIIWELRWPWKAKRPQRRQKGDMVFLSKFTVIELRSRIERINKEIKHRQDPYSTVW